MKEAILLHKMSAIDNTQGDKNIKPLAQETIKSFLPLIEKSKLTEVYNDLKTKCDEILAAK